MPIFVGLGFPILAQFKTSVGTRILAKDGAYAVHEER